jgi:hypothetical protein
MMNLRHPCIAGVIGVVLSSPLRSFQIVGVHIGGDSLSEVVLKSPEWWTPTAKAKAVVGLVLGLRFAHSVGLHHGHLTGDNVFLKEDGMIQISDFSVHNLLNEEGDKRVETGFYDFFGENFTPTADIQAFSRILSEIVFGTSSERGRPMREIPSFVFELIERAQCTDLGIFESFTDILSILKKNDFNIIEGVESGKVFEFVNLITLSEMLTE